LTFKSLHIIDIIFSIDSSYIESYCFLW